MDLPIQELMSGTTTVVWENLPLTDLEGNVYLYSVREVDSEGNAFTPEIYLDLEDGLTVTNTYIPPLTEVKVEKVWEGPELDNITINLLADGEVVEHITLSGENQWKYVLEQLPLTRLNGERIHYTVSEDSLTGYISEVSGSIEEGFVITNRLIPTEPTTSETSVTEPTMSETSASEPTTMESTPASEETSPTTERPLDQV